jgi:hypothetical protein
MRRNWLLVCGIVATLAAVAWADPTATLTLESTKNGLTVAPGAAIDWTIKVSVSAGDNAGLALISTDLVQDANNPAFLDLPAAAGVPTGMTNFARSAGISNPGSAAPDFGYRGDQRGTGHKDLVQIGGGQNTFGTAMAPGSGIAESATVVAGVAQSAAQIVATGSFAAPSTQGVYTVRLANGLVNVLNPASPPPLPPAFWPVSKATVGALPAITFSVGSPVCRGDCNCDGSINFADINAFVAALQNPGAACSFANCDVDGSGAINFADINAFVERLQNHGGPCQ